MKNRVFIAINLPSKAKDRLEEEKKSLQEQSDIDYARWTKKDNLHITLAFLGWVKESDLRKIEDCVRKVSAEFGVFKIKLKQAEYGPEKTMPPRLIWIRAESSVLEMFQKRLSKAFGACGFKIEEREFAPHLTLARVNAMKFCAIDPQERPQIESGFELEFEAKSVEIMQNRLTRNGAEYKILESFPLEILHL